MGRLIKYLIFLLLPVLLTAQPELIPNENHFFQASADTRQWDRIIYLDEYCYYDSVSLIIDMDANSAWDGIAVYYPSGEEIIYIDSLGGCCIKGYIEFFNEVPTYPNSIPSSFPYVGQEKEMFRFYIMVDQTNFIRVRFFAGNSGSNFSIYYHDLPSYYNATETIYRYETEYVNHIYDTGESITYEGVHPCYVIVITTFILDPNLEKLKIYIPNTFTPNYDGTNDIFEIYSNLVLKDITIKIYNRWGGVIFIGPVWNGLSDNGEPVPTGPYVYIITAIAPTGKQVFRKGNINVL